MCGIGDMEETEKEDHANGEFIAHAPDDIDWIDLTLGQMLTASLRREIDQQQRIKVLKKSIDLALATDPDAALKHIVGVVESLFGENAGK